MNINLENKVVIITGSSRGIGKDMAIHFAKEGAKVVINYCKSDIEAKLLYKKIVAFNKNVIIVKADISKEPEVVKLCKKVHDSFGQIDVLINNAGICEDDYLFYLNLEKWNRVISTNLTGTYLCCRIIGHYMMKNGYGKIINISSLKGQRGSEGQANYAASKAGMIGFTKSIAREFGDYNVAVNVVCPGYIKTDLNRFDFTKANIARQMSTLEIEQSRNDLLNFVLYMSSECMQGISGQVFNLDSRIK